MYAHDWHYGLTTRWFRKLSIAEYDHHIFAAIAFFKVSIILFSLAPYVALYIITR